MAVKVDKDFILKHRFWISIPIAIIFFFIAMLLVFSVRGTTATLATEAKQTDTALQAMIRDPLLRNQQWIDAMGKETDKATVQKTLLWYNVYDRQNDVSRMPVPEPKPGEALKVELGQFLGMKNPFVTWPKAMHELTVHWPPNREQVPLARRDFGEPLGHVPSEYRRPFARQYDDLLNILDMMDEDKKLGSVRAVGGAKNHRENLRTLLRPISWGATPILDTEAWIAQEEIAIKREILLALADANNQVALMYPEWSSVTVPDMLKVPEDQDDAKPAEASAPAPAPAAENAEEKKGDKDEYKQAIDRKRFLNSTWQWGVVEYDEKTRQGPSSLWYDGWLLELELVPRDGALYLKCVAANLSNEHKTPPAKVAVVLSDGNPQKPDEREVILDVGDLPANKPGPETTAGVLSLAKNYLHFVKGISKKELPDVKLDFKEARQIVRVSRPRDLTAPIRDQQRFKNGSWVIDVQLVPGASGGGAALQGVVHNRSGNRLKANTYEVTLTDGKEEYTETIIVPSVIGPMNAWTKREFPKHEIKRAAALPPDRIVGVKQILNWETTVIKRIDRIEIGLEAHKEADRTKVHSLVAYNFKKKDPRGPAPSTPDTSATPSTPPPADSGAGVSLGADGGGARSSGGASSANHNLPLRRYYEVTDELRRVPVALVLRVDMEHINDVLTAFANARMRYRTTMSPWCRVENLPKPSFALVTNPGISGGTRPSGSAPAGSGPGLPGSAGGGTAGLPGGAGGTDGPGTSGAGSGPGTKGGGAGGGTGQGGASGGATRSAPTVSSEDDASSVELQIYGLITIYESPDAAARIEEERKKGPAPAPAGATPPTSPATPANK